MCSQPASLCPQFADVGCGGGGVEGVAGASFYLGPAPAAGRLGDSSRHTQRPGARRVVCGAVYHIHISHALVAVT